MHSVSVPVDVAQFQLPREVREPILQVTAAKTESISRARRPSRKKTGEDRGKSLTPRLGGRDSEIVEPSPSAGKSITEEEFRSWAAGNHRTLRPRTGRHHRTPHGDLILDERLLR